MPGLSAEIDSQTRYAEETFKGVGLGGAEVVSSEFYDCKFIRCSFGEATFRNCRFVDCTFQGCDLSLVQVPDSSFSAVRFEDSKVVGVDWTYANWPAAKFQDPIGFTRCALNHSTVIGLSLEGIQIRDCVAANVDFREADLSRANFAGTDLSESLFSDTDLTEADLSGARNYDIDPGKNTLKKAKFSFPEAMALLYSLDIVLTEKDG